MTRLENVTTKFSGDGGAVVEVGFSRSMDDASSIKNISSIPGVVSVEKMDSKKPEN